MSGKLRAAILAMWQESGSTSDVPDTAQLTRWVGHLVKANEDQHRRSKDDFQRMDRLRQEVTRAYALPTPQTLVSEAAIGHLDTALTMLGELVSAHADGAVTHVEAAKNLLTGQPVEPCPGGCGIDLGHPGNPDRQCACPKPAPRVWERLDEIEELPFTVEVKPRTGFVTVWRRPAMSRDFERVGESDGRTMRIEQLRYLGDVREVLS